jgi:crotonobetainyl-CoA:carnitine CoA-transferase CaiB-like acyl-CoA transferase
VLSIKSDEEWGKLSQAVGQPAWADDERFSSAPSRKKHHDEIDRMISSWTESQDQMEAMHKLQAAGLTAAAVLNPKQVLFDPHLRERGFFERIDTVKGGVRPVPHQVGAHFSAFDLDSARRAPNLGEHNHEILRDILGLSDAEIASLEEKGVIGDTPQGAVSLPVMRMFVQFPLTSYQQMGALGAVETDYREQLGIAPDSPENAPAK